MARPARRRADPDRRRDSLVQATLRVIARDGVPATTTRKIAEEAGVPLGSVHYWFSGKDELFEAAILAVLDELESAAIEGASFPGDQIPDLREQLRMAWHVVEEDDPGAQLAIYEITAHALRTPGMESLAARQYAMYREVALRAVQPWIEARGIDPPGGAATLASLLAVVFDGVLLAWLADREGADPARIFDLFAQLLDSASWDDNASGPCDTAHEPTLHRL